jgi:hypothetical protein
MKLPQDAVIPRKKISNYLLEWRPENDKSQFLARAGYTVGQAEQLAIDIRQQLLALDAEFAETTEYGDLYRIAGTLTGPNGQTLRVVSIWMIESGTNITKFITLYPVKED